MKLKNPKTGEIIEVADEHAINVLIPQGYYKKVEGDELGRERKTNESGSPKERDGSSKPKSRQTRTKSRKNDIGDAKV